MADDISVLLTGTVLFKYNFFQCKGLLGFGPFRNYTENPSWELVQLFQQSSSANFSSPFIVEQLKVAYSEIDSNLKPLIDKHQPLVAVHCGVSHLAQSLTVECIARRHGYAKCDVDSNVPSGQSCCCDLDDSGIYIGT